MPLPNNRSERKTMVKIRISYDQEQEAAKIIRILSPVIAGARIKRSDNGKYKKIYIEYDTDVEKRD